MPEERSCDWCEGAFETYPSDTKRFCSMECQKEWESVAKTGEDNPNYSGASVTLSCTYCDSQFERFESQYIGDETFCCYDCWVRHQNENRERDPTAHWSAKWRKVRKQVQERDEVCVNCSADGSDEILDAHHINPVREFDDPEEAHTEDNAILLCRPCHVGVENGTEEVSCI